MRGDLPCVGAVALRQSVPRMSALTSPFRRAWSRALAPTQLLRLPCCPQLSALTSPLRTAWYRGPGTLLRLPARHRLLLLSNPSLPARRCKRESTSPWKLSLRLTLRSLMLTLTLTAKGKIREEGGKGEGKLRKTAGKESRKHFPPPFSACSQHPTVYSPPPTPAFSQHRFRTTRRECRTGYEHQDLSAAPA